MIYIILAAGTGTRLHPITLNCPKSLFKLDDNTTIIQRMIQLIRKNDNSAKIVIVVGFMKELIMKDVSDVSFVINPFYAATNSIASLWFAKEYLGIENVVIINSDIVVENKLIKDIICKPVDKPLVLLDSSIKVNGDYNIQVNKDKVVVMSKDLDDYFGEYAGVTMLPAEASGQLLAMITEMVDMGQYDQWYENALVQMIFRKNFLLSYIDIANYAWAEIDTVTDLVNAKKIHSQ